MDGKIVGKILLHFEKNVEPRFQTFRSKKTPLTTRTGHPLKGK